ncbi:MAG: cysteine hydrolase [Pseudonocardiales bacterium]|nr:cysteine hydrolase [Pseudonocardiales bacterium]
MAGARTCLLIVDLQRDVVRDCFDRDGVLSRSRTLLDRARAARTPVVFIQHEDPDLLAGSTGWKFADEVAPHPGEPVVAKTYRDAFADTQLARVLAELAVTRLVIVGAQSDYCVSTTMQRAAEEGFDVVLVSDCHTTWDDEFGGVTFTGEQIVAHTNRRMGGLRYPAVSCGIAEHGSVEL